ncbi:MAG: hypothetical protein AB9882_14895 [Ignavibacteriaceae bacterium]
MGHKKQFGVGLKKFFFLKSLLLIAASLLFLQNETFSQERYSFRLKDGTEVFGYSPYLDTVKNTVIMESPDGETIRFMYESIFNDSRGPFINIYEHTRKAPFRLTEIPYGIDTCRLTNFYFFELRAIGMYADSFYYGGEAALGLRLGAFNIGIGAGAWNVSQVLRLPVFVHLKIDLMNECIRPFIYGDAGVIFDEYKIAPAIKYLKEPGPKFAGLGLGFDIPVSKTMDFSFDGGMRYVVLPNERKAPSCNPLDTKVIYTEYYMGYLRFGITF